MDLQTNGSEASYKIISFKGTALPTQFENMIFAKFLRTLKYGNHYFRLIDKDAYFPRYHAYIESLLNRESSIVKLAVLTSDPDVVLGWALIEPGILHYVWVDSAQRNQGIARTLCSEPFGVITHITNIGASIFSKLKDVKFNPFM